MAMLKLPSIWTLGGSRRLPLHFQNGNAGSSLNLSELIKVLENEGWPPDLLAGLKQFAKTEPSATVRVVWTEPLAEEQE